jgi:hypothetical protein
MSVTSGSLPSEATERTTVRSSCRRTVGVITAFALAAAVMLAGAPAALAGPGCPNNPGPCVPMDQ